MTNANKISFFIAFFIIIKSLWMTELKKLITAMITIFYLFSYIIEGFIKDSYL